MTRKHYWTPDEMATASEMRRAGASYEEIGAEIGRPVDGVASKLLQMRVFPLEARVAEPVEQPIVLPFYFHSNLTARIFGDPPPGRSALDQRGQG